eukprot:15081-Heterococcus_DN1.PRE.1
MQLVVLWLLLSLTYCSAWSQLGAGASATAIRWSSISSICNGCAVLQSAAACTSARHSQQQQQQQRSYHCSVLKSSLDIDRRTVLSAAAAGSGGLFGGLFGGASPARGAQGGQQTPRGKTNELQAVHTAAVLNCSSVHAECTEQGHKRCGSGDIAVSEVGIGTQRWVSGVKLQHGELHTIARLILYRSDRCTLVNGQCGTPTCRTPKPLSCTTVDTRYRVPGRDPKALWKPLLAAGLHKAILACLLIVTAHAQLASTGNASRRSKVVIASKITGGGNI